MTLHMELCMLQHCRFNTSHPAGVIEEVEHFSSFSLTSDPFQLPVASKLGSTYAAREAEMAPSMFCTFNALWRPLCHVSAVSSTPNNRVHHLLNVSCGEIVKVAASDGEPLNDRPEPGLRWI